jgi:hypothetical protein
MGGVERHVGAARLEHGDRRHEEVERALQAERDEDLRPYAEGAQAVGQAVGAPLQLAVAQAALAEGQGHGLGCACGLLAEELVHGRARRVVGRPRVPLDEDLLALGRGEERQLRERARRRAREVLGQTGEKQFQVSRHALYGRGVEEVPVVAPAARQPSRRLGKSHGEIELRPAGLALDRRERQAGQLQRPAARVLEGEHDLEQRRAARVAPRLEVLDDALEGDLLVGEGPQGHLPHPAQQLAEARVARAVGAQHQGVDEEPDQPLQLAARAVGNRRAHGDVVLPRAAVEESGKPGEEQQEGGDPLRSCEPRQARGEIRRQERPVHAAVGGLHRWARPVDGQLQHGEIRQGIAPPGELALQGLALQALALPEGEVGVLDRQRRER